MNQPPINPIEKNFTSITRYHYILFVFLFFGKIPIFWQVVSLIFLTPPMDYECLEPNTGKNICPCTNYKWDTSIFTKTLQTKYGLICKKKYLVGMCHSMFFLGALLGSIVFGMVSDKYGRLTTFTTGVICMATFGCIITMIANVYFYLVLRVLHGFGLGGTLVSGYVLCVEYCGVKQREIISAFFHIPLNIGHMTLAGVSYILRDVDQYQLAISIPLFFFVTMRCIFYESPKWLMDNGKIDRAAKAMEGIAKFNKTSYGPIKADMEAYYHAMHSTPGEEKAQFWHIFRHRQLTINFVCMSVIYFVFGMGYHGVSQYIGQMSGHVHTNVAVSGAVLIPGTLLTTVLLRILNRRTFFIATSLSSGVLMLIVVIIPDELEKTRVAIACICNSAFFVSVIIVLLFVVELFPTTVRSSVLGILSVCARIGQISAPFVNQLPSTLSGILFGTFAIVGGLISIPLPETKGKALPSSMSDANSIKFQKPLTPVQPTSDQNTSPRVNIKD